MQFHLNPSLITANPPPLSSTPVNPVPIRRPVAVVPRVEFADDNQLRRALVPQLPSLSAPIPRSSSFSGSFLPSPRVVSPSLAPAMVGVSSQDGCAEDVILLEYHIVVTMWENALQSVNRANRMLRALHGNVISLSSRV